MKKFVLIIAAFGLMISVFGQKASKMDPVQMNQEKSLTDIEYQKQVETPELNYDKVVNFDISRLPVGKAKSQRSFRREDTKTISYVKELDMITISFVLDKNTYPDVEVDGVIGMFYSTDNGSTWSGPVVLSDLDDEGLQNYYLSAIGYNPNGNTNPENAYGIYQGAATDLTTWNNKAFGQSTLGGENYSTDFITNSEPGFEHDGYFNQFGLTQKSDFMRCFNIIAEGPWSEFTALQMENIEGTYNGSGIDWEQEHSVIEMPFEFDADGEAMWVGKNTFSDIAADVVWSDNGQIGYAWMTGITTEAESGFQPIMFKTTNGGDDWDFVELDFQSDMAQEAMLFDMDTEEGYIFPCNNSAEEPLDYCIPWFNASAGAVDHRGNLQLFGDLNGHYYGFGEQPEPDDLYSRFSYAGHLFKFTIGEDGDGNDGILDVMWVDSLRSTPAIDLVDGTTNPDLYCGTNGWLRRLQLTKNEFSNEFFLTWTDTREGDGLVENLHPDIIGWSFNAHTNEHSDAICFTEGSLYETYYYYVQAAEYAKYNEGSNTYTIPMVNAVNVGEFASNSNASGDPVSVDYIAGIELPALGEYVGTDELATVTSFSVSQNQPNPANESTTIEIRSNSVEPVKVEVVNLMGQNVYTLNAGNVNGVKTIDINTAELNAGVYFYTVTIGNESISKKMIIE